MICQQCVLFMSYLLILVLVMVSRKLVLVLALVLKELVLVLVLLVLVLLQLVLTTTLLTSTNFSYNTSQTNLSATSVPSNRCIIRSAVIIDSLTGAISEILPSTHEFRSYVMQTNFESRSFNSQFDGSHDFLLIKHSLLSVTFPLKDK